MKVIQNTHLNLLYKNNLYFINHIGIQPVLYFFVKRFFDLHVFDCFLELKLRNNNYIENFVNIVKMKCFFYNRIKTILLNHNNFYYKKLNLQGIGFKSWVFKDNQKHNFLMLKIGFSFDVCFFVSSDIKIACLKFTTILLKGLSKQFVNHLSNFLRKIKKWSVYKNKGIFYFDSVIKIKPIVNKK